MATERRSTGGLPGRDLGAIRDAIVRRVARAMDSAASRLAGRPASVRIEAPLGELRRGRLQAVDAELTDVEVGGLVVDHMLIRITELDFMPALPPRLHVPRVRIAATVTQRWVDRWLAREWLPVQVRLAEQGLATSFSLDSFGLGEIETELVVVGGWLRLKPRRAGLLELPGLVGDVFSGYLPLPKLPPGARLDSLQHDAGELIAHFELPGFDESLTAGLASRIGSRLFPPADDD
jgi:hypothetical protein